MTDFNSKIKRYELVTKLPPLPSGYPISAKIVLDSISPSGKRLTTFELVFPRYMLPELSTHRVFSKNASSSRAIPTQKMVMDAWDNKVLPVRFGKNKKGMQADAENLNGEALEEAMHIWNKMAATVREGCLRLAELGLHKQWASRPAEWFSTIKIVLSGTEFENFFWLRDHFEAQEEICYLAQAMKIAMNNSDPTLRKPGEWHLPYVSEEELNQLGLWDALSVSSSRCARTSYKTHLGVTSSLQEDMDLFKRLVHEGDEPFHASPTEHQATPMFAGEFATNLNGNLVGWNQHRKYIEHELINHV